MFPNSITHLLKTTTVLRTWAFRQILPVLKLILRIIEKKIEENLQTPKAQNCDL